MVPTNVNDSLTFVSIARWLQAALYAAAAAAAVEIVAFAVRSAVTS